MIFDMWMGDNFCQKARLVADRHKTKVHTSSTYSTVVSRDSVHLFFILAPLNGLYLLAADVENTYLNVPCRKHWIWAWPEFSKDEGCIYIVVQALYGFRSSWAAFCVYLTEILDKIGFKSSIADPDVWLQQSTLPDNQHYYKYILVYVDNILCISHNLKETILQISNHMVKKRVMTHKQV